MVNNRVEKHLVIHGGVIQVFNLSVQIANKSVAVQKEKALAGFEIEVVKVASILVPGCPVLILISRTEIQDLNPGLLQTGYYTN
jgi:hypothetical protein